jgi:ribosomal protein L2
MAIKTFRPTTAGLRHRVQVVNSEVSSKKNAPRSL